MLKKSIITFALMFLAVSVQAADFKIGVVDTKAVLSKAPQLKAANDRIKQQFQERQNELVDLQKQGEELKNKAKREQMTMTNVQRLDIDRQLQALDSQFSLKQKFFQEDIKIATSQEQQKVAKKINEAIQKIAAAEKFDLIIAREVAIHAVPAIDITDKVIAMISNPAG